jgi:hypothetical protein
MKLYQILHDLPPLPEYFVYEILDTVKDATRLKTKTFHDAPGRKEYRERMLTLPDGSQCQSVTSQKWTISSELEQWLQNNIQDSWIDVGINLHNTVSHVMGPHIDDIKNEIMMYVIEPGGSNVETTWWQQHGFPAERPDKLPAVTGGFYTSHNDYRDLTELDRVCIVPGQWVRMSTLVLHSVENITAPRTILKIGL